MGLESYMIPSPLSQEARNQLLALKDGKDTHRRVRQWVEMVLLSDAGWENAPIARHLGVDEKTVQRHVRAFRTCGVEALAHQYGKRGPHKATPEAMKVLDELLAEGRIWNAVQLRAALQEKTGVDISIDHLRVVLKKRGYSWKRTKRSVAHSRKPEVYAERREQLESLKKISG